MTVLVLVIAAIVLGIVFYKKERRYLIQFAVLALYSNQVDYSFH